MPSPLSCKVISKIKDFYGVWEVCVQINGKEYTFPIGSEYAVEKFEKLLKRKPGKAINFLKQFKIEGFNSFEEEEKIGTNRYITAPALRGSAIAKAFEKSYGKEGK